MSDLTAWERWELGSFDGPSRPAQQKAGTTAAAVDLPTVEELEQIREQARQEGHSAGYAAGQKLARSEAEKLGAAAARLDGMFKTLEGQVADELLALAVELGRQVVRGELAARPETVLDVVRQALVQLPHQHASIFLCPDDAALVRTHLGDQLGHAGHRIHEDPQLKRGDCVIEAGSSQVDATVATRWRRVIEALGLDAAWQVPQPAAASEPEPDKE